jgi:hypothetical protein
MKQFYAYIHAKPDYTPFYVGKGTGTRSHRMTWRNQYHTNIVAKYGEENILISKHECSTEAFALELEIGLIKCLKRMGFALANLTDGGEGTVGLVFTDEHRSKLKAASTGHVKSAETRAKISANKKNPSAETRAKMRAAKLGKKFSEEHKRKVSAAGMGRVCSPETKEKLRVANTGQICTDEMKAKLIAAHTGLPWSDKRRDAYNKKQAKIKEMREAKPA